MRYSQDTNGQAFNHQSLEGEQVIPTSGRTDDWDGKVSTIQVRRWVGRGRRHRRAVAIVFVSLFVAARGESNSGEETAVRLRQEPTPAESVSRPGRPTAALQRAHERAELCGRQEPPLAAGRRWASRIALRDTSRGATRSKSAAAARSTSTSSADWWSANRAQRLADASGETVTLKSVLEATAVSRYDSVRWSRM